MDTEFICSVCLENARHAKNQIQEGMLRCYCCNLNLPIDNYRKHHKKCKQCEQIAHLEWQRANAHHWRVGGKYYRYKKKKTNEVVDDYMDSEQLSSLNNGLNYII